MRWLYDGLRSGLPLVMFCASVTSGTFCEILKTKRELYEILSAHSGVSLKKIERDADRDYWLTAAEAREYGLIDEVLAKREKK